MPYDEKLAERVRRVLGRKAGLSEKKMFGGVAFLLKGKMVCGVLKDNLVARVNPQESDLLLKKPGVRPMDFTGRPMKGYLYVGPQAYSGAKLASWVERCAKYVASLSARKK